MPALRQPVTPQRSPSPLGAGSPPAPPAPPLPGTLRARGWRCRQGAGPEGSPMGSAPRRPPRRPRRGREGAPAPVCRLPQQLPLALLPALLQLAQEVLLLHHLPGDHLLVQRLWQVPLWGGRAASALGPGLEAPWWAGPPGCRRGGQGPPPAAPAPTQAQGPSIRAVLAGASPRRARFCGAPLCRSLLSTRLMWLRRMNGGASAGRWWYSTMRWKRWDFQKVSALPCTAWNV